jgi:DNA invertase Pin-like site-specific DNA recombinase
MPESSETIPVKGSISGSASAGGRQAARRLIPVVQYLRESTDHQEQSAAIQSTVNRAYAVDRGMSIIRTYQDKGKSGLRVDKRSALRQLINDVRSGAADFTAILVYDVSRWGRFQDVDEAGYYEFVCKRSGIRVHYCAELFENDGSLLSTIAKDMKRAMAGEYSRELSARVFAAHARLAAFGYSQGGAPSYGLRRVLLDQNGHVKLELKPGNRKNIQTDRVIFVPGDPEEVKTIRWIFKAFVKERKIVPEIARNLNCRNILTANGDPWTTRTVRRVLHNERYAGNYVWNRISTKLGTAQVHNAPNHWVRADGVIAPIVAKSVFAAAQKITRKRSRKLTQVERLKPLHRLLRKHGRLTHDLIARSPNTPSVSSYRRWFGRLSDTCQLIGYTEYRTHPSQRWDHLCDDELIDLLRPLLRKHGYLNKKLINHANGIPRPRVYWRRFGSMARSYRLAMARESLDKPYCHRSRRLTWATTFSLSDEQLLELLRRLLREHGRLTQELINTSNQTPSGPTYAYRFGSLKRAYELIGYKQRRSV